MQHYLLIVASFGVMLNGYSLVTSGQPFSIGYGPRSQPGKTVFRILFYLLPWVFLIWTAWSLLDRTKTVRQLSPQHGAPEVLEAYKKLRASIDRDRNTYFSIVLVYPIFCLAFLFLFSDFGTKVFGFSELAGIQVGARCEHPH